jgi:glycosyltransferase involved in cell wall biosynthesis
LKLSIILVSFNQEKYIVQALESIFLQKLDNYETELIIADDCSVDKTPVIIRDFFANRNPHSLSVKLLEKTSNLGISKNYERAFSACSGDYIAILEGDDYWTDENRLHKMIHFMESKADVSLAMNRYSVLHEKIDKIHTTEWKLPEDFEIVTTAQMAQLNRLGNLSACIIRKKHLDKKIYDLYIADWMLGLALSEYGSLAIMKDVMSVYRSHESSEWSKMSLYEQVKKTLPLVDQYNDFLENRYASEFSQLKEKMIAYKNEYEKNTLEKQNRNLFQKISRCIRNSFK